MLWQLDTNYRTAGDTPHSLVGAFIPELASVLTPTGAKRVIDLLSRGKWLLIDTQHDAQARSCVTRTGARVEVLSAARLDGTKGATQLLVRPDGYVAWAASAPLGAAVSLDACLHKWFSLQ